MRKRPSVPDPDVFNFNKMIDSIMDYDWPRMVRTLNHECERGEHASQLEYASRIRWVLHWFYHNALADGDKERAVCYRIATRLIEKGQMKPEGLDAFGKADFIGRAASLPEGSLESVLGLRRHHDHSRMIRL